jgi:hypothetical protein
MTDSNQTTTQLVIGNSGMKTGDVIQTPAGFKDVVLREVTPFVLITMRALWAFVNSFLGGVTGMLGAQAVGHPIVVGDLPHVVKVSAALAAATVGFSFLKNVAAQWTALGDKYPLLKA